MRIACIGSRNLARDLVRALFNIGRHLVLAGHLVVSGNARGADQAFGRGVNSVDRRRLHLFLPWKGYEQQAIRPGNVVRVAWEKRYHEVAASLHPVWADLSNGATRLMARNVAIIESSDLVIGYPSLAKPWGGGTGFGFAVARAMGKSVVDLARGEGLDLLFQALKDLPWPLNQDMLLEVTWLQRLGGRLDRPEYRERMQVIGAVLLAELAEKSAAELADAIRQIPASLLWRLLEGRSCRQLPTYDEDDCIDWRAVIGGVREDPIRHRVYLPPLKPTARPVEVVDPESPEQELRELFVHHDSGNPMGDRERGLASLHDGQRRWAESCVAMPSGIVLQAVEPERDWAAPRYLRNLSWTIFRKGLGQPKVPGSRVAALRQKWAPMIDQYDFCLLRELHRTFERLELPEKAREEAVQQIVDQAWDQASYAEFQQEAFPGDARRVVRAWIEQLAAVAETEAAAADQGDVQWDVFEQQLRDKYPAAHEAFVSFAMDKARNTWAQWQAAPTTEVEIDPIDAEEAVADGRQPSTYRENQYVVVGHLHQAIVPWAEQRSRATKPTVGDRARELFSKLTAATTSAEVEKLAAEVVLYAGRYREVLDGALVLARKRVKHRRKRSVARLLAAIAAGTSVKRLEKLRGAVAQHPRSGLLTRAIDGRIATLRTLRSGRLTDALKRGFRHLAHLAADEGGGFSARGSRRRLLKELGKCREEELLDRLTGEARRVFLTAFLAHRVLMATRRPQVNVQVAGIKAADPVLVGRE